MEPTTGTMVHSAQEAAYLADELVEAAAALLADAVDLGNTADVERHLNTYRRAKAERRYAYAVLEAVRADYHASRTAVSA